MILNPEAGKNVYKQLMYLRLGRHSGPYIGLHSTVNAFRFWSLHPMAFPLGSSPCPSKAFKTNQNVIKNDTSNLQPLALAAHLQII